MKAAIAPCGHPGTHVTNTFITCNYRCGFGDTRVPILANPRREPGHVDMCACAPCQIRRRSERLELTDHKGVKVSLTWDGVRNRIDWTPGKSFNARHYTFRDAHGDDVASGVVHIDLVANHTVHIDIQLFMDAVDRVRLSIEQEGTRFHKFDPSKVIMSFNGIEIKGYASGEFIEYAKDDAKNALDLIEAGCKPVSIGAKFIDSAPAGGVARIAWAEMTFDRILDDMTSLVAKHLADPETGKPDTLLVSGSFMDVLIRQVAEITADTYRLAEEALFAPSAIGYGKP